MQKEDEQHIDCVFLLRILYLDIENICTYVDLNQVVLPPDSVTYPLTQSPTPA